MRFAILTLVVSLALITTISNTARSEDEKPSPISTWLGPQQNDKVARTFVLVVGRPIDKEMDHRLSKYKLGLRIVRGSKIELPKTSNPLVTFDGKKYIQDDNFKPDPDELYVVTTIQLDAPLGWRIYTLNARVKSGPLKDAIVHFRDDKIQESIQGPCHAVYKVPKGMDVKPGNVPFEIVSLFAK